MSHYINSNVTVLIQGPLTKISLSNLGYYRTVGKIVISYWEGVEEILLEECDLTGITLVKNGLNIITNNYPRQDTADRQLWGIYKGLQAVETEVVIRTRSDEYWGNLDPLLKLYNPNKVACGNIFFRRWGDLEAHIGDHVFIGRTSWLLDAYKRCCEDPGKYNHLYCLEQSVANAIINAAGYTEYISKEVFQRYFDAIHINELKPFLAQYRHGSKIYLDDFYEQGLVSKISEL